jgi:hypothetical protein
MSPARSKRIVARFAVVLALLTGFGVAVVTDSTSASAATCGSSRVYWTRQAGKSYSANGSFCRYDEDPSVGSHSKLIFQTDGNLVLYYKGKAVAATGTNGRGKTLKLQTDGNVVVYNASGTALWAGGKMSSSDAYQLTVADVNIEEFDYEPGGDLIGPKYIKL